MSIVYVVCVYVFGCFVFFLLAEMYLCCCVSSDVSLFVVLYVVLCV